jgi:hypothetical protein
VASFGVFFFKTLSKSILNVNLRGDDLYEITDLANPDVRLVFLVKEIGDKPLGIRQGNGREECMHGLGSLIIK